MRSPIGRLGRSGQTAVEYIFMISVVAGLIFAFGNRFRDLFIGNGDCMDNSNQGLLCKTLRQVRGDGALSGNFRYYRLPR